MTDSPPLPVTDLATIRRLRSRINAYLDKEMGELASDPMVLAQHAVSMSGLEFLQRWLEPEIPSPPPVAVLFGMEWIEVEPSRVVLSLEPAKWMLNPLGTVHGGVTATLLDTVLGCAIQTNLPPATGYATSDLQVRYLRALSPDVGRILATGTVVHAGRRHATAEGRVEIEATGKLIATGTTGCTILTSG